MLDFQKINWLSVSVILAITFMLLFFSEAKGFQQMCAIYCEEIGGTAISTPFSCSCNVPNFQDVNTSTNMEQCLKIMGFEELK